MYITPELAKFAYATERAEHPHDNDARISARIEHNMQHHPSKYAEKMPKVTAESLGRAAKRANHVRLWDEKYDEICEYEQSLHPTWRPIDVWGLVCINMRANWEHYKNLQALDSRRVALEQQESDKREARRMTAEEFFNGSIGLHTMNPKKPATLKYVPK